MHHLHSAVESCHIEPLSYRSLRAREHIGGRRGPGPLWSGCGLLELGDEADLVAVRGRGRENVMFQHALGGCRSDAYQIGGVCKKCSYLERQSLGSKEP